MLTLSSQAVSRFNALTLKLDKQKNPPKIEIHFLQQVICWHNMLYHYLHFMFLLM